MLVNELPFLVTAPPETPLETETEVEALTRPQGQQRASVNPFSPIIVRERSATTATNQPQNQVRVVTAPAAPPTGVPTAPTSATAPVRPAVEAPAPRALTPPSTQTTLPRALPGGTLPVTPEILRRTQSAPAPVTPTLALAEVAAIRVPSAPEIPLAVPASARIPKIRSPNPSPLREPGPSSVVLRGRRVPTV